MTQYLLLIYTDENKDPKPPSDEFFTFIQAFQSFTKDIAESGHFKSGDGLEPVATATTVRVRDDKTLVTDGPFAETKEQLGGYYLIEAENLDEATQIASRIPSAKYGSIEIRPITVYQ